MKRDTHDQTNPIARPTAATTSHNSSDSPSVRRTHACDTASGSRKGPRSSHTCTSSATANSDTFSRNTGLPAYSTGLAVNINALWLEKVSLKRVDLSLPHVRPPVAVRWAGLASLLLWTAVIVCGRLIPYLPSWD